MRPPWEVGEQRETANSAFLSVGMWWNSYDNIKSRCQIINFSVVWAMFMKRRNILASIAAVGSVAITGCSGNEPVVPQIKRVELLSGWSEVGDVADNAIASARRGSTVGIGILYEYYHVNGQEASTAQVEIIHESGEQLAVLRDQTNRLVDYDGWAEWEWYLPFSTTGASLGQYEATALVQDDENGETSESKSTTFRIIS